MSNLVAVAIAVVFWVGASLLIGLVGSRLSLGTLRSIARVAWWLRGPSVGWYRRQLQIETWKDRLPEAGGFGGGMSKRHLLTRQRSALERMYLETMEKVLGASNKVIIDSTNGSGVIPYLPLSQLAPQSFSGAQK